MTELERAKSKLSDEELRLLTDEHFDRGRIAGMNESQSMVSERAGKLFQQRLDAIAIEVRELVADFEESLRRLRVAYEEKYNPIPF